MTKDKVIALYDNDKYEVTIRKRGKTFSKANEMIQKSKFSMTMRQQKLISYMLSCLKAPKNDIYNLEILFNMEEYCRVTGIDYTDPKNYKNIQADLKKLRDKSLWIPIKNKDGTVIDSLVAWIEKTRACEEKELVYIKLDEDLAPFLFDLTENFTPFELRFLLGFEKKYSMRLYELIKSWNNMHKHTYSLDELRYLLGIEDVKSFSAYKSFKSYLLIPCIEEINEKTDIKITMKEIYEKKSGKGRKKVEAIEFRVTYLPDNEIQKRRYAIDDMLDGTNKVEAYEQISLFDFDFSDENDDAELEEKAICKKQADLDFIDEYLENM